MKPKIRIFMCTHKPYSLLPPLACAVQGGAALRPPIEGTIPDVGEGGSISEKNPEYCELTVQYYAWKNEDADYYGFCHYRRFFGFGAKTVRPYLAYGTISERKVARLLSTPTEISSLITGSHYDIIVPRPEHMGESVREQYANSEHCYAEDLDLFIALLKRRYPHLSLHASGYLLKDKQYFCNMFIMKRELFFEYCEHLFPLLEEFDRCKTPHGDFQSDRTDGYLAERFFGIYLSYLRATGQAKVYECPRIDTECPRSKRILWRLFPPETKRRFLLKRLLRRLG